MDVTIKHKPTIDDIFGEGIDGPADDRADKPWPAEEDCAGCDKHKDGPHRFKCRAYGVAQTKITVDRK